MEQVEKLAKATTGAYPTVALGLILALVLLVLYFVFAAPKQGFMPGATLRYQKLDGLGFEGMEGGGAPKEGSAAWNILQSPDFACDKRGAPNDDAWSWMYKQSSAAESAVGGRPKTESDFTKLLAGQ